MYARLVRLALFVVTMAGLTNHAMAEAGFRNLDDPDAPKWVEDDLVLPVFPQEPNLREFYVSEMTTHRFFIDTATLSVGRDGVVRYVLVVRTSGGAVNVTYEGMRCSAREYRIYASGRKDGAWAKARHSEWKPIENKPINRQHAALSRDFFCPDGVTIRSSDEGREALRLGRHPEAN